MDLSLLIEKYLERIDEGPGNLGILPKEWLAPLAGDIHKWGGAQAGENSEIIELGKFVVKEGKPEEGWRKVRELTNKELKKDGVRVAGFYFTEDNQPLYLLMTTYSSDSKVNLEYKMYYNNGAIESREKYVTRGSGRRSYSSMQSTDRLTIEDLKDTFAPGKTYKVYVVYVDLKRIEKIRERESARSGQDSSLDKTELEQFKKMVRTKLEAKFSAIQTQLATESNALVIEIMLAITSLLNGEDKIKWEKRQNIEKATKALSEKYQRMIKLMSDFDFLSYDKEVKKKDYDGKMKFSYHARKILDAIDKI